MQDKTREHGRETARYREGREREGERDRERRNLHDWLLRVARVSVRVRVFNACELRASLGEHLSLSCSLILQRIAADSALRNNVHTPRVALRERKREHYRVLLLYQRDKLPISRFIIV